MILLLHLAISQSISLSFFWHLCVRGNQAPLSDCHVMSWNVVILRMGFWVHFLKMDGTLNNHIVYFFCSEGANWILTVLCLSIK